GERGADSDLGAQSHLPAHLGDQVVHEVKTQPGPLADVFRGEEGVEDASSVVLGDAASGIANLDLNAPSGASGPKGKRACPGLILHRLTGVGDQIDEDLLELHALRVDEQVGRLKLVLDGYPAGSNGADLGLDNR